MKLNFRLSPLRFACMLGLLSIMFFAASCEKDDRMDGLRGQWQIMEIERPDPQNPGGTLIESPSDPRLYICFDLDIIQLTTSGDLTGTDNGHVVGTVAGEYPAYTFTFPYNLEYPEIWLAETGRWGISENPARVEVSELTRSRLVMKVGENTIILRKF